MRADHTYFNSHQVLARVGGPHMNKFVWIGLKSWTPDVTTLEVPWGPKASWVMVTWDPREQIDWLTDTNENITFLQLRWRALIIFEISSNLANTTWSTLHGHVSYSSRVVERNCFVRLARVIDSELSKTLKKTLTETNKTKQVIHFTWG